LGGIQASTHAVTHGFLRLGNPRPILQAALQAAVADERGVLALVLETEGSTYCSAGAMAFFGEATQVGWLSGGCLEPELALRAKEADADGRIVWMEIDTRADEDLLSGSALGCRGRLRIAMIPLRGIQGCEAVFDAWLAGGSACERVVHADGGIVMATDGVDMHWQLPGPGPDWTGAASRWSPPLPRPPEVMVLGAGPESPVLLRLLREMGWRTTLVERRMRWRMRASDVDAQHDVTPAAALMRGPFADVVLVMHHNFELDREALDALSTTSIRFVGLLGPRQRRDDLFKLLSPLQRDSLLPRLHAPVGLDLGGSGPEAIALSIAAQLQSWRTDRGI